MEEQANGSSALETIVVTRERELVNDFKVRRVLPSARRRMVGPFVFLDQMGPELLRGSRRADAAGEGRLGLPRAEGCG